MPQSLAQIYVHLIFSTKDRQPIIHPDDFKDLNSYLGGILNQMDSSPLEIGSVKDHVHILYRQPKNHALKKLIEEVKTGSSKWFKTKGEHYRDFYWQTGYGAFSVSASKVDAVRKYILNQEQHHQRKTYKEEFLDFLKRYRCEYDERYLWD